MAIIEPVKLSEVFWGKEKPVEIITRPERPEEAEIVVKEEAPSPEMKKLEITKEDIEKIKATGEKVYGFLKMLKERAETRDIRAMERELVKLQHLKELEAKRAELERELVAVRTRTAEKTLTQTA